jgi:hypothetical protein
LVTEELGKVSCPVCGTDYDDSVIACPKCGAMGLEKPDGGQIKREGVPVSLPPPRVPTSSGPVYPLPPQPYEPGPRSTRDGYHQQFDPRGPPGPTMSPFGFQPRVLQSQEGWALGLGVGGLFLGMGGLMLGFIGIAMGNMVCGGIGGALCIISIIMGAVLTAKGQRIGIGVLAMGIMGLVMFLMVVGMFWWISQF